MVTTRAEVGSGEATGLQLPSRSECECRGKTQYENYHTIGGLLGTTEWGAEGSGS